MIFSFKQFNENNEVLLAPNGNISNLNPIQWNLVRTPEFKNWFGDWENDKENSSKVLDKNGEPLVVYHGSRSEEDFYIFDKSKGNPSNSGGFYFSNKKDLAKKFSRGFINIKEVFLNIKDPVLDGFDGSGADMSNDNYRDGGIFTKRNTDRYAEKGTKE